MAQKFCNIAIMDEPTFDEMRDDLNRAYMQGVLVHFHIGKVPGVTSFISEIFYSEDQFDVYISMKRTYSAKENVLKKYMRKKYGHIIRILVVELQT